MSRQTVTPSNRFEGRLEVPGDKSISHRALIVSAMGHGACLVTNLATAEDVTSTRSVLEALGVAISHPQSQQERQAVSSSGTKSQILVEGRGVEAFAAPQRVLDCGNSGTTLRSMLGVLAGSDVAATLDGDDSLRRRPMRRVVDPLRAMGAEVAGSGEHAPLEISGRTLAGIDYELPIPSAQIKTALLLAGSRAGGATIIRGGGSSRDHTERMLEYLGVPIEKSPDRLIIKSTEIQNASSLDVPGDLSSAAFLLVAAAIIPGGDIQIDNLGVNPTRAGILELLRAFGADVSITHEKEVCGEPRASVRVRAGDRRPLTVGSALVPQAIDELPLVAVLGAYAEGETVLTGAAELRVKESDRIASLSAGLASMGGDITPLSDGFTIRGGRPLHAAAVGSAGDHRIGMALAVAALGATGPVSIDEWESVGVSYPGFEHDLTRLTER